MDLATLAIAVTARGVQETLGTLERLTTTAGKVEGAVNRFARTMNTAFNTGLARGAKQAMETEAAMERMRRTMGPLADQAHRNSIGFGGMLKSLTDVENVIRGAAIVLAFQRIASAAGDAIKAVAELDGVLKRTGVSAERFQALRLAAENTGMTGSAFTAGIEALATKLNEARHSETVLGQLFKDNNIALTDRNGKLISVNQQLKAAAELMSRVEEVQDKIKLAEALGFDKTSLDFFDKLAKDMGQIDANLKAMGGGFDENIIKKAKEAEIAWNGFWANFSLLALSHAGAAVSAIAEVARQQQSMMTELGNHPFWKRAEDFAKKHGMFNPEGLVFPGQPGFDDKPGGAGSGSSSVKGDLGEIVVNIEKVDKAAQKAKPNLTALFDAGKDKGGKEARFSAYDNMVQRTKDRIKELELEASSATKTAEAVIKLKLAHDLERAAKRDGREVTEAMRMEWARYGEELARVTQKLENVRAVQDSVKGATTEFAQTFVRAMMDGKKASEALAVSLKSVGASLTNKGIEGAITGALSGNMVGAGIGAATAAIGIGLEMFGRQGEEKKKRQEQMQEAIRVQEEEQKRLAASAMDAANEMVRIEQEAARERVRVIEEFQRQAIEAEKAAARRRREFGNRSFDALNDPTTQQGALAAFDRRAQQEREAEMEAGGQAILELEMALQLERAAIVKDFTNKQIEEQRRLARETSDFFNTLRSNISSFILGLKTGAESPLTPMQRFIEAQKAYNATLAAGQAGDQAALSRITSEAKIFIDAARAIYASSGPFQDIFNLVTGQLEALPTIAQSNDAVVNAINVQTATLLTPLDATKASTASVVALTTTGNALQTTANQLSSTISSLTSTAQLATQENIFAAVSNNTSTAATQGNTANQYMAKIVTNTYYAAIGSGQTSGPLLARGGWVSGPGTSTSDSIHARLSRGEYVVNAASAARHANVLGAINDNRPVSDTSVAAEVRLLRREVGAALARLAQIESDGHAMTSGEVRRSMGRLVDETRLAKDAPKRRSA
jgi:hypothetical protein